MNMGKDKTAVEIKIKAMLSENIFANLYGRSVSL